MQSALRKMWLKPAVFVAASLFAGNRTFRAGLAEEAGRASLELTNHEDLSELMQQNKFLVLDFYADWCGPCRRLTPVLEAKVEELHRSGRFSRGKLVKVNVDQHGELCDHFKVGVE